MVSTPTVKEQNPSVPNRIYNYPDYGCRFLCLKIFLGGKVSAAKAASEIAERKSNLSRESRSTDLITSSILISQHLNKCFPNIITN